jgi:hypothetical protein
LRAKTGTSIADSTSISKYFVAAPVNAFSGSYRTNDLRANEIRPAKLSQNLASGSSMPAHLLRSLVIRS